MATRWRCPPDSALGLRARSSEIPSSSAVRRRRAAGAAGFGIGSALYKPGMKPEAVKQRAKELMQAFEAARSSA
jgi:hypothetical protein